MIRTRTPSLVSQRANTKPVGPAPTMRTSVSRLGDAFTVWKAPSGQRYARTRGSVQLRRDGRSSGATLGAATVQDNFVTGELELARDESPEISEAGLRFEDAAALAALEVMMM